jgi:DNA-binding transcriptional MocR family regulator
VGNVIYTGTFSKSVAPALRIGWIVAPAPVIHKLVLIKQASDLHSATLNQMVLAEICEDAVAARAAELCRTYGARRDAMLAALARHMPKGVTWTRPDGGMFVWVTLPPGLDAKLLLRRAIEDARVAFVPGGAFFTDGGGANTLRLSFSLAPPDTIAEGIRRLAGVVSAALTPA